MLKQRDDRQLQDPDQSNIVSSIASGLTNVAVGGFLIAQSSAIIT